VVVTTGAIVKMSPSTNQHPLFTGRMPFLSPNQQCQSTVSQYNIELRIFVGLGYNVLYCS